MEQNVLDLASNIIETFQNLYSEYPWLTLVWCMFLRRGGVWMITGYGGCRGGYTHTGGTDIPPGGTAPAT